MPETNPAAVPAKDARPLRQPVLADALDPSRDLAAERALTAHLRGWGYAPGDYFSRCIDCDVAHIMDKRAWRCLKCAQKLAEAHRVSVNQDDADTMKAKLGEDVSGADLLAAVVARDAKVVASNKDHSRALYDFDLPDFVSAFIAMNQGPATETMAIEAAGLMPRVYATYTDPEGKAERVRITMVSRLGDVGISREDKEHGYFTRLSLFDLTDFDTEMNPGAPARRVSSVRHFAIADKHGNWVRINPEGSVVPFAKSPVPILYPTAKAAYRAYRDIDPHSFLGLHTVAVQLSNAKETA